MSTLSMFVTSTSGYVSRREGLSLGWMAGAIAGTAVVFGMANPAAALTCPPNSSDCGAWCTGDPCGDDDFIRDRYCNFGSGCVSIGDDHCSTTC